MHHLPIGTATVLHHFRRMLVGATVLTVLAVGAASAFAAGGTTIVRVAQSNLGRVLVDAHGKTLYVWAHDKTPKSTCNGACAEYWPPLLTKGRPQTNSGANSKLLSTSKRSDGRVQVTYAGHPLYYFALDTKAGQTKGEGLTDFGGRWDPISAAGQAVRKNGTSGSGESTLAHASRTAGNRLHRFRPQPGGVNRGWRPRPRLLPRGALPVSCRALRARSSRRRSRPSASHPAMTRAPTDRHG
jgi:predicted lipoprotein with Yx(FWY)xxD motif